MRITVRDILAQGEGYRTDFQVVDEELELEEPDFALPLNGQITLQRTDTGLGLEGSIDTAIVLECHRCLREFAFPEQLKLRGQFSEKLESADDGDSVWPIEKDHMIDIAPLVRQEAILGIPIKQLCQEDCPGLDPETGQLRAVTN